MADACAKQKTCFVVMGFGEKTDLRTGRKLNLDNSYRNLIKPAVEAAGVRCVRADEIVHSGLIDVPMYDQIYRADVVVADISTLNPNALYELGVRHALRPHTTIVIAEVGLNPLPFDLNHLIVRFYHHLGEDIGCSEARTFGGALTASIREILGRAPSVDSPVYTFLNKLTPPSLSESIAAQVACEVLSFAPETEGDRQLTARAVESAPSGAAEEESLGDLTKQAEEALKKSAFQTARALLESIRAMRRSLAHVKRRELARQRNVSEEEVPLDSEDPYLLQRLALATYKSKQPSEEAALFQSREILTVLNPRNSNDPETLGLWGAVHKRLWDLARQGPHLDEAIRSHQRGFYLRGDYYNGINLAFLLNVRAAAAEKQPDTIADFVLAARIRQEVIAICREWLNANALPPGGVDVNESAHDERYWVHATVAEAYLGIGQSDVANEWLQRSRSLLPAPPKWMVDTTERQMKKLQALLACAPFPPE